MKKFCLVALLFLTQPVHAQNRVWHYITTHKRVLVQDGLVMTGRILVTEASIRCQNISKACIETNDTLGPHPSALETRAYGYGTGGLMVVLNHVWEWQTGRVKSDGKDDKDLRPLAWFWVTPLVIFDVVSAHDDWQSGNALERKAQARLRVSR